MVLELVKVTGLLQKKRKIKRAARLEGVVDVTLFGTASLEYWTNQLEDEALEPIDTSGSAQIMIISSEGRFWGQRFRELSISVLARPVERPEDRDGAYLVAAFNSNRFFAFCERRFFSTPYEAEYIEVGCGEKTGFSISRDEGEALEAEVSHSVTFDAAQPDTWGGPVYLPTIPGSDRRLGFMARIEGKTVVLPFAAEDTTVLTGCDRPGVFQHLSQSGFYPSEWRIRPTAVHEKSKTYERSLLW